MMNRVELNEEMMEQVNGGYHRGRDMGEALLALFFFQVPGFIYYMCTTEADDGES